MYILMVLTNISLYLNRREDKASLMLSLFGLAALLNHATTYRLGETLWETGQTYYTISILFLFMFPVIGSSLFLQSLYANF